MSNHLCRRVAIYLTGAAVILGVAAAVSSMPKLASAQQNLKQLTIFIEPDVHYDFDMDGRRQRLL